MNIDLPNSRNRHDATHRIMRFLKGDTITENTNRGGRTLNDTSTNFSPLENSYAAKHAYDYRRRMAFDQLASDRFGEELSPEAAIWNMYLDEAQVHDRELVEGRQRSLDTLLLFAALFSAILTAFLIESKDLLQQDPADASAALLLIIAQLQQRIELGITPPEESTKSIDMPGFSPPLSARWINGVWFMSLALSLSAALIAMLGKEWLTAFNSSRPRSTRRLAFIRQARLKGLEDWGALHIIALLPTLLHLSLLLFSVGLVIFLWGLDAALAAVMTGVISITFAFYVVTGILGAVYEFCPFVTEVSHYTHRAVKALFRLPSRDQIGDSGVPSLQDLQALVWLSKQAGDPVVVDYAYQAMAGLHHSPYIAPNTIRPRPNSSSNALTPDEATLFGRDITINSLLLKVSERFDDLLVGTLETGSVEPPVCRYINAMIALGSYTESLSDDPLVHWLGILGRIDRLWSSDLPQKSLSGSSFAGVLIAEMDVLRIAMELLQSTIPLSGSPPEIRTHAEPGPMETNAPILAQYQYHIDIYQPNAEGGNAANDPHSRLQTRLAEWLEGSLALLCLHTKSEATIDAYLVTSLLRAIMDATRYFSSMHSVLRTQTHITPALESRFSRFEQLRILMSLLSQPTSTSPESLTQLTEVLKMYAIIAPVVLLPLRQQDGSYLSTAFAFQDLDSSPPTSRREILAIVIRYMMISAGYLCSLLQELPECRPIFADALKLVFACSEEGRGYPEPRGAFGHHVGELVRILEFFASSESNLELMTVEIANILCLLPRYPLPQSKPAYGVFLPPNCIIPFIKASLRNDLIGTPAAECMDTLVNILRGPSELAPPSPLPPQTIAISERRPVIEYLQKFTHLPGSFSMLIQVGSKNYGYATGVSLAIAQIVVLAADFNEELVANPVELRPPVVHEFLEALAWALPRVASLGDFKRVYSLSIVAASDILIAASRDSTYRTQIANHSSRMILLQEFIENADHFVRFISQERLDELVNKLNMIENNTGVEDAT